jgi:hypothetical protein
MERRIKYLLIGALLGGVLIPVTASAAEAATPPLTGTVSCALSATSTFTPWVNYGPSPRPGFPNHNFKPRKYLKFQLNGHLSGCTGTQTGGNPRVPGPIRSGDIVVKGKAPGRGGCTALTTNGVTVRSVKIRWFDAAGNRMSSTNGTGTLQVAGLRDGFPPVISVNPIVYAPGYVPPGIITLTASGTGRATARAFPGRPITMSAVADQDLEDMREPCSYAPSPLEGGINGFGFHGVNGPSTISIG